MADENFHILIFSAKQVVHRLGNSLTVNLMLVKGMHQSTQLLIFLVLPFLWTIYQHRAVIIFENLSLLVIFTVVGLDDGHEELLIAANAVINPSKVFARIQRSFLSEFFL